VPVRGKPAVAPTARRAWTLSAICPCPREFSRPGTRTATDTVRGNCLTCANMQERVAEAGAVYRADLDLDDTQPRACQHPGNT